MYKHAQGAQKGLRATKKKNIVTQIGLTHLNAVLPISDSQDLRPVPISLAPQYRPHTI